MEPQTPGIKTSEGVTAIVAVLTPLAAALGKLEGWQLVAALGVAAFVAAVYIGARTWLKGKGVAALLVLALLVAPVTARADLPAAEVRPLPPAPAEPVASESAPKPPTIAEVLSCTAADTLGALPAALTKCAKNPAAAPPIDSRVFWTVFASSLGNAATTIGGILVSVYLNPDPVK